MANFVQQPSSSGGFTDPNLSPQVLEWIKRQMMDQAISAQARQAVNASPVLNTPGVPANPAIAPQPQAAQAPVASTGAPPMPQPQAQAQPFSMAMPAVGAPQPPQAAMQANPMQAMNGLPADISPGPATTPEEQQARKSGWQQVVETLKADPHLQLALLRMGTQLMQPVQPGQTPAGHFGQALAGSVDYLQAQKESEAKLRFTNAQTRLEGARADTEERRPAGVEAETESTQEKTKLLKKMTPLQIQETQAKIRLLGAQADLDSARQRDLEDNVTLRKNPRYAEAVIAELEAKAWALRNPGEAAKPYGQARLQYVENLAKAIIGSGQFPEIDEVAKTDPKKAHSMAVIAANDRAFSAGAVNAAQEDTAQGLLDNLQARYDSLKAAGDPLVKNKSFEAFVDSSMQNPLSPIDKKVATQVYKALSARKKAPAAAPGQDPNDPLGLRKK